MSKFFTGIFIIAFAAVLPTSSKFSTSSEAHAVHLKKQHCLGYTIVEAGKGVDCYGDTVVLIKRYGYYQMALISD